MLLACGCWVRHSSPCAGTRRQLRTTRVRRGSHPRWTRKVRLWCDVAPRGASLLTRVCVWAEAVPLFELSVQYYAGLGFFSKCAAVRVCPAPVRTCPAHARSPLDDALCIHSDEGVLRGDL